MTINHHHFKSAPFSLEAVIIFGLGLKLLLSAVFLMTFHTPDAFHLRAQTAHAEEAPKNTNNDKVPKPEPKKEAISIERQQFDAMLESLRAKERELERQEARLQEREKALNLLEKDIQERLDKITATKEEIAALVKKQQEILENQKIQKNARIEHLVAAYKSMRPEQAGLLVNSLDDAVAVQILAAMPGRNAGQILAYVEPAKAARLTKTISLRISEANKAAQDAAGQGSAPTAP